MRGIKMRNKHEGSRLEDFLREEGICEEVKASAIKKVLAVQMLERMQEQRMSKAALGDSNTDVRWMQSTP